MSILMICTQWKLGREKGPVTVAPLKVLLCATLAQTNPLQARNRLTGTFAKSEDQDKMGLVATKPFIGVSDKARLKPVSSAT